MTTLSSSLNSSSFQFRAIIGVFALVLGLLLSSCAETRVPLPVKVMPAGASFHGTWYSPIYKKMVLVEKGGKVSGIFQYKYPEGGTIEGVVEGGVLVFDWMILGNNSEGRRAVKGKGYFVMLDDGKNFKGESGMGSKYRGERWKAEKSNDEIEEILDKDEE